MRTLQPNDPINIQYTSGTTGYPKGATLSHRNILNNGYFVTETINLTEHDRLCIPVPFYHCFGMVMGNLGCTTHGATMVIPAPGFDPETTLRRIAEERCTAVYGVPDHVHRDAEPPDVPRPRPDVAEDRHHGRLDLPGRGDEALHRRHAHGGGLDRLRHDRDLARLLPDPGRRRPRPADGHDRQRPPARRDQDHRPRHRRDRRARSARGVLHARLLGDARLLGGRGEDRARPSTRTAGCTPATSPRCARTATATSSAGSRTW